MNCNNQKISSELLCNELSYLKTKVKFSWIIYYIKHEWFIFSLVVLKQGWCPKIAFI